MKSLSIALMVFMAAHTSLGATTCYLSGKELAQKEVPTGIILHSLQADGFSASAIVDASGVIQQMSVQDLGKQVKVFSNAKTQEADLSYIAAQTVILVCLNK